MRRLDEVGPFTAPPLLEEIRSLLAGGAEVFLVGGAVRDGLLGRRALDLDFVSAASGIHLGRQIAARLGAAFFVLDSERAIARVLLDRDGQRHSLDFSTLRGSTIAQDLGARDFTVNAIALPLTGPAALLDPLGGVEDLRAGLLRACSPGALGDDPVRAVRAVRLVVHLNLRLDPGTREQVRTAAAFLPQVAHERTRDELFRILDGPRVSSAVHMLMGLGLLPAILPELAGLETTVPPPPHVYDVWNHTLHLLDWLERLLAVLAGAQAPEADVDQVLQLAWLRLGKYQGRIREHLQRPLAGERPARGLLCLAALLHDAGKPETLQVGAEGDVGFPGHEHLGADWAYRRAVALRFSNDEADHISRIVRQHARPVQLYRAGGTSPRAAYHFFRSAGTGGVEVCLLALADVLATYGPTLPQEMWAGMVDTVRVLLEAHFERGEGVARPHPLLTGEEIMAELGLRPGPQVGEWVEVLREAQAAGEIMSPAEALAYLKHRSRR